VFSVFLYNDGRIAVGREYENSMTTRSRIIGGTVLAAAVVASLLIATGTIASLGAMAAVVASTVLTRPTLARTRLLKFCPSSLGNCCAGFVGASQASSRRMALAGITPGAYL
jgi:hypothetical protein